MPLPIGPFTVPPQPDEDSWFARFLMGLQQEPTDRADSFWQSEPEPEGYDRVALDRLMSQWEQQGLEGRVAPEASQEPSRWRDFVDSIAGPSDPEGDDRARAAEDRAGSESYGRAQAGLGRDIFLPPEAADRPSPVPDVPRIEMDPANPASVSVPGGAPGEMVGPPRNLMEIQELSPSLLRDGRGGDTTWTGVPHQRMVDGAPQQFGTISATMAGPRPTQEESRAILAPNAFNAPPAPRAPGPPVPTTVTASRFDPAREAFVPIGPPTGDTGVRESYSAVPYDPEGERIRAMEREMQDLEMQRARGGPADPLARERFRAQQDRQLLLDKAGIDQMSDADRKRSILEGIRAIGEDEAASIEKIQASARISDKEKLDRIAAVKERTKRLLQAFGVKSQEPTF